MVECEACNEWYHDECIGLTGITFTNFVSPQVILTVYAGFFA